jgi:uncharacterized membrane protein
MKDFWHNLTETLKPYRFRLTGLILGLIVAVLFLTVGFFKTLLIIICIAAGFVLGYFFDDRSDLGSMIDKVMSRIKGEK